MAMPGPKIGATHYNWPGYDLEGFAARASEIGYRYCELQIILNSEEWTELQAVFKDRSPQVTRLGEEMTAIMNEIGWGTPEQALQSLVAVRDSLGLQVNQIVLVMDPLTGDIL